MDDLKKIRKDMFELYKGAACYEGGWAIATGPLMEFINRIDKLLKENANAPQA